MWFPKAKKRNSLAEIFSGEVKPSLFAVLQSSDLFSLIRGESSDLVNFIMYEEGGSQPNVELLFRLALSNSENSADIDFRFNRNASNILSAPCKALQTKLLNYSSGEKPKICEYLANFMKSESCRNPELAGHFQRIFISFTSFTQGKFLHHFPDLLTFLLKNLDVIPYQYTLLNLLDICPGYILPNKNMFDILLLLSEKVALDEKESHPLNIVGLLMIFIKDNPEKGEELRDVKILANILTGCEKADDDSLHMFNLIRLANLIVGNSHKWADDVIREFYPHFKFDHSHPTNKTLYLFPIFAELALNEMIPLFFSQTDFNTIFNNGVLGCLERMKNERKIKELSEFVDNHDIIRKTINAYHEQVYEDNFKTQANGHTIQLGIFLFQMEWGEYKPKSLIKNREWDLYIVTVILPRIKILEETNSKIDRIDYDSDSSN